MALVSVCCDRNMNDVISTGKMHTVVETRGTAECFHAFFPVEMASFIFLSQHRDTIGPFIREKIRRDLFKTRLI